MTRHTVRSRLAPALAALLLVASCSGGGSEESLEATEEVAEVDASSSTTEPPADPGAAETAGGGDTTTDGTGGATGDDAAAPTSAPPAPDTDDTDATAGSSSPGGTEGSTDGAAAQAAAPGRPIVPRSGTYTYERTRTTADGTETETTDTTVERLSGDERAGRLRIAMDSEQGRLTNTATSSDDGLLVERSVIDSPLGEVDCDWQPDWLYHGAFVEGGTWTVDTSCSDTATGLEVDIALTGSGRIVGYEDIEVAGATVTAWVVETTTVTEFTVTSPTLNGTQRSETVSRSWVDPSLGMQVRGESRSDSSGDFQNGTTETVSEFVRFTAS